MKNTFVKIIYFTLFLISPLYAYIGPGLGGGIIATIIGIFGSFFLLIFGILYYPIKRFFKNRNKKK